MAWERVAIDVKGSMNDLISMIQKDFAIVVVDLKTKLGASTVCVKRQDRRIFGKGIFMRRLSPRNIVR